MSDAEPKPETPASADPAPAPAPSAATATADAPPPARFAASESPPSGIDWGAMVPETVGELALDIFKVLVAWAVVANSYAVAKGVTLTTTSISGAAGVAIGLVLVWKVYLRLVERLDQRLIGATYAVLGAIAGVGILVFAGSSGSADESRELRIVVGLVALVFLYPAVLGAYTAVMGEELEAANPLGIPYERSWFSTVWTLYSKEVRTFFTTPIPYLIFFVFMVLNGVLYFALIRFLSQRGGGPTPPPAQIIYENFVFWVSVWCICGALTMRLISEEFNTGTIETLLTAPVTDIQVIIAKFAGAFTVYAFMLSTTLVYLALLALHSTDWDWGPVFGSYLGLALVGGLFLSVGLFWSSVFKSQLVAFLFALATNFGFFLMSLFESFVKDEKIRDLVKYLSYRDHYREMLLGVVTTRSLVFFVSLILFFLFCAVRGLESQKWK